MSYYYDQLEKIAKREGKSLSQVAKDVGIPYSTVCKWKKRNPHKRYIGKINTYIIENSKAIEVYKDQVKGETTVGEAPIVYDNDGVPVGFWDKLKEKYLSNPAGEQKWVQETEDLKQIIISLAGKMRPHYKIISPIDIGGTAVVLKIRDELLGVIRALKFPRPIEKHKEQFAEIITTEIGLLVEAAHKNIVEVYDHGEVDTNKGKYPYYIMKYVKDSKSADEYFEQERTDGQLLKVIEQVAMGIRHLHSLSIVHLDIKPENILVSGDGDALLSDLGSARKISQTSEEVTILYTKYYAHPDLMALKYYYTSDSNRYRGKIDRPKIQTRYDLYSFGKTMLKLLKYFEPYVTTRRMPSYSRKYFYLMACRALDGENTADEVALGLGQTCFRELKYNSIDEIIDDIEKFKGEFPLIKIIPELNPHIIDTVQAGSEWKTPLTNRLIELLKHPSLQRLASVSQLGLLIQIYPTATHTRLQHALGTFSHTIKIIEALYNDPINPLFKQIMKANDIICLLLAALLHDIGHFPLAHDLHEALPKAFDHNEVTIRLLKGNEDWFSANSLKTIIQRDWGVTTDDIASIIEANPNDTGVPIRNRILHTIINGPIDADKLDYLTRDSHTLKIPYANAIDFNRLLNCLTIIFRQEGNRTYAALGIHEKGKISAESIAFARYAMYGAVYWHHTFRSIKAMLHRAVWECRYNSYPGPKGDTNLRNAFSKRFFSTVTTKSMLETSRLDEMTQVLPSDREVLNWLYEHTSSKGKTLVKALNKRELFKRVTVLSAYRSGIWRKLIDFRSKRQYEDILSFQEKLQELIVDYVKNLSSEDRKKNSILTVDNTEHIVALHQDNNIIVLIDIPLEQPAGSIHLEYLPESSRHNVKEEWLEPAELEASTFWAQLYNHFLDYVGKIRLFAHPEIVDVLAAAIEPGEMEKIIDRAMQFVVEQ